ncbi:MAG: DUF4136 domain-containing protein [Tenacibaculum sp.]
MMKLSKILFIPILVLSLASCSSVRVATDYDSKIDFSKYKTFAFYKTGIDKAPISDLDKKRIMRSVETELLAKGMTKSSNPDVLVSIFTKSRDRISFTDNFYGYGGFWYPWHFYGYGYYNRPFSIYQHIEGTLFIDLLDAQKKELIWQGIGTGALNMMNTEQKKERIREFVKKIMAKYPLGLDQKR